MVDTPVEPCRRAIAALRRTDLFGDLESDELAHLAVQAKYGVYDKRRAIAHPGGVVDGPSVIARGEARLYRCSWAGDEVTLATLGPGEVVELSPVSLHTDRRSCLESTVDGTEVYTIARVAFQALVARRPSLALAALELVSRRLNAMCDRVEELALYDVGVQLAHELAEQARRSEAGRIDATHEELAAWIGSKQVEVTRGLRRLREERLIASDPHRRGITVLDPGKLAAYKRSR